MASLDSVKQKVIRAREHLKCLEGEVMRYFSGNPGDVVTEVEESTGRLILRFIAKTPVPPDIPMIVGDVLQNLRSSLDYLVWELVLAAKNQPTDKHMFPVCTKPEAFKDQVGRGRLAGIPTDALTMIENLQPYHYGQKCESAPIRVLDAFCNVNKHRRVLLTVLAAHIARTQITSSESGISVQEIVTPRFHNAEIAVGPMPVKTGETVEMKGDLISFVTFDEGAAKGMDISGVMNHLWLYVDRFLIPSFEKFFV